MHKFTNIAFAKSINLLKVYSTPQQLTSLLCRAQHKSHYTSLNCPWWTRKLGPIEKPVVKLGFDPRVQTLCMCSVRFRVLPAPLVWPTLLRPWAAWGDRREATPKPVQGQDRAQPAGEGLRSLPLPMGHAPAAARSRRWSADPLLKCNPTNWKSKSVVGKVLSKNVKIRKCVVFYLFDRFTFEHLNRLEASHFRSD